MRPSHATPPPAAEELRGGRRRLVRGLRGGMTPSRRGPLGPIRAGTACREGRTNERPVHGARGHRHRTTTPTTATRPPTPHSPRRPAPAASPATATCRRLAEVHRAERLAEPPHPPPGRPRRRLRDRRARRAGPGAGRPGRGTARRRRPRRPVRPHRRGTDEIQKQIIGDRALGLPRGPSPDRDVPFSELRAWTPGADRRCLDMTADYARTRTRPVGSFPASSTRSPASTWTANWPSPRCGTPHGPSAPPPPNSPGPPPWP